MPPNTNYSHNWTNYSCAFYSVWIRSLSRGLHWRMLNATVYSSTPTIFFDVLRHSYHDLRPITFPVSITNARFTRTFANRPLIPLLELNMRNLRLVNGDGKSSSPLEKLTIDWIEAAKLEFAKGIKQELNEHLKYNMIVTLMFIHLLTLVHFKLFIV